MTDAPSASRSAPPSPPGSGAKVARAAIQLLCFATGVALLWWCIHSAFSKPQTLEQLSRLLKAPWWQGAAMLAISATAIALDGLMFRAMLRPVRRLRALDMIGVAGVCSALTYLPFKITVLFRFLYHTQRDRLPALTIVAWIIATGILLLISLVPIAAATMLRPQTDSLWWAFIAAIILFCAGAVHATCRFAQVRGFLTPLSDHELSQLGSRRHFKKLPGFAKLADAARMLADPRALAEALLLRLSIVSLQGARFALAAHIVGVSVTPEQALIAGAAYNFIQALSPGGVAGFREKGATTLLAFLSGPDILAVTLTVSAAEAAVNLVMGISGAAYLRVDKLLLRERDAPTHAPRQQSQGMRTLVIIAAIVFVISACLLVYMARSKLAAPVPAAPGGQTTAATDPLTPDANIAGTRMPTFTLTTQDGKPLTREDLLGKITIVDFMFTHCPYICPKLTARMGKMAADLKETDVRFLSISVDPVHDTPERLTQYAAEREIDTSRWTFATGDQATLKRIVTDELKFNLEDVPTTPVPLPDGSTMSNISHPGHFVLIGPGAEVLAICHVDLEEEVVAFMERAKAASLRLKGK